MFTALGHLAVRRRRIILLLTGLFFAVSAALGTSAFDALKGGGFEDPEAESTAAADLLEERFGQGSPDLVLLVTPAGGDVDAPDAVALGSRVTEELAGEPGVRQAVSYWSLGQVPPLRSEEGDAAIVLATLEGDEAEVDEAVEELAPAYTRESEEGRIEVGGLGEIFRQVGTTIEEDLARAESIAVPITLVLLVFIFGGLVAAALPLFVGVLAIFGTFLVLWTIAQFTDVSIFSTTLTTAMGLGLAIDYSLFMVSRFREELRRGLDPDAAVVRTVETAGRTIAFSALTVAVSLSALLVFPLYFLRSFGYAGIAVVLVAGAASVMSLASLLAVLGPRVNRLQLWHRRPPEEGTGFWHRVATGVMRRPVAVSGVVIAALLVLGAPFLRVAFGQPDDRVLPDGNSAREVSERLREDFSSNESFAFGVVARDEGSEATDPEAIERYAITLSRVDGVERVDALPGSYVDGAQALAGGPTSARFRGDGGTWFSVVPSVEPVSAAGEQLVDDIRSLDAPFEVVVGGSAAELVDSKDAIVERLPHAAGVILATTFVLLFLMFGSVLVPVKAILLNLLSLTATFGAMVWIFQEGNGSGLLDFTATGTLDTTTPILMFCIAFGLSMDYEVFLLSRIKEEHDLTGDNTHAVAMGLERTGRIVTAAAVLLSVTFLAFSASGISFIKLFGLGLALAVVMDATVVRATLVPAFMRLAGEANWWAPGPLRRLHRRLGIHESAPPLPPGDQVVHAPTGDAVRETVDVGGGGSS